MEVFGKTDIGRMRKKNEDHFFASSGPVGFFDALAIVCDGMGGHSYGEIASETCINAVVEYIRSSVVNSPEFVMSEAVYKANRRVKLKTREMEAVDSGTTLVMAGIIDSTAYIANIGDSRAYLISGKDNSIRQITRDHSLVEEQVQLGLIERYSPEYERHKNVITRAVGIFDHVEADFFKEELEEDSFILLCSDGLSNMVPDLLLKNLVLDDTLPIRARVHSLVRLANENGGRDNITAVLISKED